MLYPVRKKVIFSTGFAGYDYTKIVEYAEATIIYLQWINGGFVNMRHLRKIIKLIVWTLSDMKPMTDGCHYSMGCENDVANCAGSVPQLNSTS